MYGASFDGCNANHSKVILNEFYTIGDSVLYLWDKNKNHTELIFGTPLEDRQPNQVVPINGIQACHFVRDDQYLVFSTTLFDDTGGLGYIDLSQPAEAKPLPIKGVAHEGMGEFGVLKHLHSDQYLASYNIDGCDWVYQGGLDENALEFNLEEVLVGQGQLANGVLDHVDYEKESGIFALSFSTATSPTQIYTIENGETKQHTRERILGIPEGILSTGEDASFTSFDGLRVSARLYLPNDTLGFNPPYPLVYYIHGGPQSQERPDFSWFSMPLIQFLTTEGFAVFVPNVRGSAGYGMSYMKKVDRDWGGDDRLDHVHAMTQVLPKDTRLDTQRAAVVGRSYGGYMTLVLASRHPELWRASCDMFGPYDLITFSERIPETWKPYFKIALADPDTPEGHQFLTQRSPRASIENLGAPMLVVQGKNDPRVVEQESRDLVEHLRSIGKEVEYLMFENEGHDVLKFENRVTVYNAITDFFKKHLSN
jgi:dipeptidyl aminopeptidase/acylaminoacyl peptidase